MAARRKRGTSTLTISLGDGEDITFEAEEAPEWRGGRAALEKARAMLGEDFEAWRQVYARLAFRHVLALTRRDLQAARTANRLLVEIAEKIREACEIIRREVEPNADLDQGLALWNSEEGLGLIAREMPEAYAWFNRFADIRFDLDAGAWEKGRWRPGVRDALKDLETARVCAVRAGTRAATVADEVLRNAPAEAKEPEEPVGRAVVVRAVLERAPNITRDPAAWALMSIVVGMELPCRDADEFWKGRFVRWKTALQREVKRAGLPPKR